MEGDAAILWRLIEFGWVALVGFVVHIYRKITGLDTQQQVISTIVTHIQTTRDQDTERHERQRAEDEKRRIAQRAEMLEMFKENHDELKALIKEFKQ